MANNEKLTDAVVQRLIGHANVVYYNCETNAWNTKKYNGHRIKDQDRYSQCIQAFKSEMEQNPEFNQHYELAASVTMTIDMSLYQGCGHIISNPQYSKTGTAVIGNIIAKDKTTRKYKLYCKFWVGVHNFDLPFIAACEGAGAFASYCASDFVFRMALIAAHTR